MKETQTTSARVNRRQRSILEKSLLSSRRNSRIDSFKLSHVDFPLKTKAAWRINKLTLHGGKQEGVDIIEVDNGQLRFVVVPTRGMSVLKVECGDVRLGWDSPVKEVVHPQFMNLESRGGLGWLDGFNEWMVRCGLEWAGHPGKDKFRNNVGAEVEMDLTLHGKIANIPASEVEVSIESGTPPRIHVRGLVNERMFHGPNLSILTDITTELGSNSVEFRDIVTNHGVSEQEFQIIYHANFGPPLLGEGARFVGAVHRVTPFNGHAARAMVQYSYYSAPEPGFVEQVYCLEPRAGADGQTELLLQNAQQNRGVSLTFPLQHLPCVTLWKNLGAAEEGYVTGIEPGTGFPYTRRLEREAGRVPKLMPGESRRFSLQATIHSDRAGVQAAKKRIQQIKARI